MSTPPSDVAAEKVLLGCLMMGGTADGLTSPDFFGPPTSSFTRRSGPCARRATPLSPSRSPGSCAAAASYRRSAAPTTCTLAWLRPHHLPRPATTRNRPGTGRTAAAGRARRTAAPGGQQPRRDLADVRALAAGSSGHGAAVALPAVVRLADVEPERIDWLWPGYLPLGKVVVIDGDPGIGKSTVCLDIAARVSTGSPMPDGSSGSKGVVMVLSAEDGLADTIRPRLDAAQADAMRVITVTEIGAGQDARPVSIPGDLPALDAIIAAHEVKLVIVDVLMAYLAGDVNAHRDQDIRRALHVLSAAAARRGCCVLVLRHLNKSGGANAMYRGGGSIGIIGAARAGFMCGRDPEDETGARRIFANVKMNIAAEPPSLAYQLVYDELHDVARVGWLGASEHRAIDLLSDPGDPDERSDRDEAAEWLTTYLTEQGEARAGDVIKAARADGIAQHTIQRARKRAGVTTAKATFGGGWVWRLSPPEGDTKVTKVTGTGGLSPSSPSLSPSGEADPPFGASWPAGSYGDDAQ